MPCALARKGTQRIMTWLPKDHVKGSKIPNRLYNIYIQVL